MTKAEAIVMLKRIQEPEAWEPQINQAAFDALDMAIKALEQQPCGDTISRQDAIDAAALSAAEWDGMYVQDINGRIREALEKLPSAQPEQTKMIIKEIREWINSGNRGSADYFIVDKIEEIINKYELGMDMQSIPSNEQEEVLSER